MDNNNEITTTTVEQTEVVLDGINEAQREANSSTPPATVPSSIDEESHQPRHKNSSPPAVVEEGVKTITIAHSDAINRPFDEGPFSRNSTIQQQHQHHHTITAAPTAANNNEDLQHEIHATSDDFNLSLNFTELLMMDGKRAPISSTGGKRMFRLG